MPTPVKPDDLTKHVLFAHQDKLVSAVNAALYESKQLNNILITETSVLKHVSDYSDYAGIRALFRSEVEMMSIYGVYWKLERMDSSIPAWTFRCRTSEGR